MPSQKRSAEAAADLRNHILTLDPAKVGIEEYVGSNSVWGTVMETTFPEATVTLVALADGSASLYFSSGGGVIGGSGHESVRNAARHMSLVADRFVSQCRSATDFPYPRMGDTSFYLLTRSGKVTMNAHESDLGEQRHSFSPLFNAGQEVIHLLMQISEKK